MSDELVPVNVWLSGRSYRIRIKAADEELVRLSVKTVNDKIQEFKNLYAGKDEQDFLAMALLMYAVDSITENGMDPTSRQLIMDMQARIAQALPGITED